MAFVRYKDIQDVVFDEKQYLQTGISKLDKQIVGLGRGQLIIITGTRAGGKTTLLGQLMANFMNNGYDGLVCSFEMTNPRLRNWLNLQLLGKDNLMKKTSFTGKEYYVPRTQYAQDKVVEWVDKRLMVYDNSSFDIRRVERDIVSKISENPNISFVILDNLMKLDIESSDKWQAQSQLVKRLQILAQQKNICLILVAHPNKIKVLPRIEDVGGSGDIINTADTVILVHRVTTDFKIRAKEYFGWKDDNPALTYDTIIEIAKDREFGDDDSLLGVYFEPESKRFLNYMGENVHYGWEKEPTQEKYDFESYEVVEDGDLPF